MSRFANLKAWARKALLVAAAGAGAFSMASNATAAPAGAPAASSVAGLGELAMPLDPKLAQTYPLRLNRSNRGARLNVINAARLDRYGAFQAPEGKSLLVISTEWENIIPLSLIGQRKDVPTSYVIPNLGDHLYLLVDGRRVERLLEQAVELPGHVPVEDFTLAQLGSRIRGNVIFTVPKEGLVGPVELRFYDFAHGHITVPLTELAPPPPEPTSSLVKNEVIEAGVYGVRREKALAGQAAPEGQQFVIVDLRARSMFTFQGDATAFDPKARPGQKMEIGTVADWTDSRGHLHVVADTVYAYPAFEPATTLPEAPRFLPDIPTGGQVAFLVPEQTKSLMLRCDFPNAKTPEGKVIHPRGIELTFEGKEPGSPSVSPIRSVTDDTIRVDIIEQSTPDTFAGAPPAAGKRWLVVDVVISTTGSKNETFQTPQQLVYNSELGEQIELDPLTYMGVYRPSELVLIPVGERRGFEVAYQIPARDTQPQIAYNGFTKAEILKLKPIKPAASVAGDEATQEEVVPAQPKQEVVRTDDKASTNPPPQAQVQGAGAQAGRELKSAQVTQMRVKAKQPHTPGGIEGVGLTPKMVNDAIDRGAASLWAHTKQKMAERHVDFGDQDEHFLVALALIHADAHEKFPDFHATLRGWLTKLDPNEVNATYQIALICMIIESYGDPTFHPLLRQCAQWILEHQGPEGTWGYGSSLDKARDPAQQPDRRVLKIAGGRPLDGTKPADQLLKRLEIARQAHDGDNSVTQYAVLGLHAASRAGFKVEPAVWKKVLDETLKRQHPDTGGWAYHSVSTSYGSMTCAGICTVTLARHELGEANPGDFAPVERGLGWLVRYFTVAQNPEEDDWLYYYLYSLERVGRFLNTEFIGDNEWYAMGTQFLLRQQRQDGLWSYRQGSHEEDPMRATGFALLFLTRATESLEPQEMTGPGTLITQVIQPPEQKVYIILDCSGTMQQAIGNTSRFEIARQAMLNLVGELSPGSKIAVRAFGHRKSAIEPGADEDTELVFEMDQPNRDKVMSKLERLRPRGKTPLARTLLAAAKDLNAVAEEGDGLPVLLVTDGGDDNTRPPKPPLEAVAELAKIPGVRFYVLGFDVENPAWAAQLKGLSERGNGQYLAVEDGDALLKQMRTAVLGTPENFTLLDPSGKQIAQSEFGTEHTLEPGKYTMVTTFADRRFADTFWINAGTTTAVTFDAANVAANLAEAAPAQAEQVQDKPKATPATDAPTSTPPPTDTTKSQFCTNCGAKLTATAKFCTSCGTRTGL